MIFAFLTAIMAAILERYTEAIWFGVITIWSFAMIVFGMCGSRSRNFVGIFSLLHLVLSVAVLWFWFRTMSKIYWNYHEATDYAVFWLCFLFESIVLVLYWVLFAHMQNIDLVYNANRGIYEFIANQQNEAEVSDYGSTISFDNNNTINASASTSEDIHSKRQ
jgi:hypothetical protein